MFKKINFLRAEYPGTKETREIAISRVMLFFVLPITLLYFNVVPVQGRMLVLLVFSILIYGSIKNDNWTSSDFGISVGSIKKMWKPYLVYTVLALIALVFFANSLNMPGTQNWWMQPHFIFLFIFVSTFQEFAFRGFLMPVLGQIFPDTFTIITINALLFAFMHAIYPFPYIGLPFAFVIGVFFATLYKKYPNLILISISHSILNFVAVWYGFFKIIH